MSLIEARRNRKWIGCIDFGTAMSKAAVVRRKPRTELTSADVVPLAIGDRDGMGVRSGLLLPSVVYVSDQGTILFGKDAEDAAIRGERRSRQAFVSPKEYLSTRDPGALDEALERKSTRREISRAGSCLLCFWRICSCGRAGLPRSPMSRGRSLSGLRDRHGMKNALWPGSRPSGLSFFRPSPSLTDSAASFRRPAGLRTMPPVRRLQL